MSRKPWTQRLWAMPWTPLPNETGGRTGRNPREAVEEELPPR